MLVCARIALKIHCCFYERSNVGSQPPLLERIRLRNRLEDGQLEATVPLDLIYREDVLVDEVHVRKLAGMILAERTARGGSGQTTPVNLAYVPEMDTFPITDGFHRVAARISLGDSEVDAKIRPDSTWEDVINHRIIAAVSHKEVTFARIVDWIGQMWGFTPWQNRLKLIQALRLEVVKADSASRLGLPPNTVENVQGWVRAKCAEWSIGAPTILDYLITAEIAAPKLVKEARRRPSGHRLDALTPGHVSAIARPLPNRHDVQIAVADEAKARNLTIPLARALALACADVKSIKEVSAIAASNRWRNLVNVASAPSRGLSLEGTVFRREDRKDPYGEALIQLGYAKSPVEAQAFLEASLRGLFGERNPLLIPRGETIYRKGDTAGSLVVLRSGIAKVYDYNPYNKDKIISELVDAPSILGEEVLHGQASRATYTEALTNCTIQYVHEKDLGELLKQDFRLGVFLLIARSIRASNIYRLLHRKSMDDLQGLLSSLLLEIEEREHPLPEGTLTQGFLAELAGCTRESANKHFGDLQRRGIIFLRRGHPQIIQPDKLRVVIR